MSQPAVIAPWMHRARKALRALLADPSLWQQVRSEVDAFFVAHPQEPRTQQAQEVMTVLVFERLTAPTEPTTEPTTAA